MIPILITLAFIMVCTIIGFLRENAGEWFGVSLFTGILLYIVWQGAASIVTTKVIHEHHETPIVSLQDGSQIQGQFRGGLFVSRGTINETEYFSYYHANGDGTYSLDKQLASLSVIQPDATPETAHLSSDSHYSICTRKWWNTWCGSGAYDGTYDHGVFHVPSDAIVNDFVLDAK